MRGERVEPRVVSAHYWMSGVAARRLSGAPMILSYHTVEARKIPAPGAEQEPLSSVRKAQEAALSREASRVVCFTEYDLAENLRIFPDDAGQMNRSALDVSGSILAVSQFTLYGDARKGRRPDFLQAARPEVAEPLIDYFVAQLRGQGLTVATGQFRAMMDVELINEGPVTLWLDTGDVKREI